MESKTHRKQNDGAIDREKEDFTEFIPRKKWRGLESTHPI